MSSLERSKHAHKPRSLTPLSDRAARQPEGLLPLSSPQHRRLSKGHACHPFLMLDTWHRSPLGSSGRFLHLAQSRTLPKSAQARPLPSRPQADSSRRRQWLRRGNPAPRRHFTAPTSGAAPRPWPAPAGCWAPSSRPPGEATHPPPHPPPSSFVSAPPSLQPQGRPAARLPARGNAGPRRILTPHRGRSRRGKRKEQTVPLAPVPYAQRHVS